MTYQNTIKHASVFAASALALAVASASHAVDFEIGDTEASVYGYAKLDMIYDVDNEIGEKSAVYTDIALDGTETSDGHTNLHAAESRIGFSTATPMGGSTLKTMIEGDFYGGTANAPEFRLRNAFGEWNGILAGQTWSNFASFVPGTATIDFTGPGGRANLDRQTQLRYTTGGFSVAIEDPDKIGGSVATTEVTDLEGAKNRLPDLTARYEGKTGDFSYAASGVLRHLEYDDVDANSDDSATGWGVALAGALAVTEALTVRGGVSHGDGIGGYLDSNPYASPAYVDEDGGLETVEATGGTLGASLKAGPGSINAVYSIASADLDDAVFTDTDDTYESVWVNYIWSPASNANISYGIEASHHSREQVNGDDGDALRLQGMVKYSF